MTNAKRYDTVVLLEPMGKFQKGVDYMGDIAVFEAEFARHVAIRNYFDSYKLSIHTGSDKFSIYPIIARHTGGQVHVKTAGTSYLESVRLAYFNGYTYNEVATLLDKPLPTIKTRMRDGLIRLRDCLEATR